VTVTRRDNFVHDQRTGCESTSKRTATTITQTNTSLSLDSIAPATYFLFFIYTVYLMT
jgi:hypothetical protein